MTGTVYLVGAGPGDPELLTVKAQRLLARADAVFHDHLVSNDVLRLVRSGSEVVDVGKRPGGATTRQDTINELLVEAAKRHDVVVRLKGGDPLIFGRGAEEAHHLHACSIAVEIVPGITSALGLLTSAGVTVTSRGVATGFAVVTGRRATGDTDWSRYACIDTLVILMGVGNRADIAASLIAAGRSATEPTMFIERGSMHSERRVWATLSEVARGGTVISSPAVWVVGEVTSNTIECLAKT